MSIVKLLVGHIIKYQNRVCPSIAMIPFVTLHEVKGVVERSISLYSLLWCFSLRAFVPELCTILGGRRLHYLLLVLAKPTDHKDSVDNDC